MATALNKQQNVPRILKGQKDFANWNSFYKQNSSQPALIHSKAFSSG